MLSTWLWLLGSNSQPSLQGLGLAQYAILITSPKLTIMLCMMNCGPSLSLQLKAAYARLKCVCDDWHYCIICFGISPLLVFPPFFWCLHSHSGLSMLLLDCSGTLPVWERWHCSPCGVCSPPSLPVSWTTRSARLHSLPVKQVEASRALSPSDLIANHSWYPDTGATCHMTPHKPSMSLCG